MIVKKVITGLLACLMAMSLTACGASNPGASFQPTYYPEAYEPIKKAYEDESHEGEVKGALIGAASGAAVGAAAGGLMSGDVKGAAIGAGVGAVAGAVAGFSIARYNKIEDQKERLETYRKDLDAKDQQYDLAKTAAIKTINSYKEELDKIGRALTDKTMDKEEANKRIDEIIQGVEYARHFYEERAADMDKILEGYTEVRELKSSSESSGGVFSGLMPGKTQETSTKPKAKGNKYDQEVKNIDSLNMNKIASMKKKVSDGNKEIAGLGGKLVEMCDAMRAKAAV